MRQIPLPQHNMCNSSSQMHFNVQKMGVGGLSLVALYRASPILGHPRETGMTPSMSIQPTQMENVAQNHKYERNRFDHEDRLVFSIFYLCLFPSLILQYF